jgi:hypothetical protein
VVTLHLRRVLATTSLGLALFGAAACADQPQVDPIPSSSPSKASTLADKKTTCAAYLALVAETSAKGSPLAEKAQNAQQDPSAALSALVEFKALIADYEAKLTPITANAGDPQVKTALEADLAEARKVKADIDAAGVDPDKLRAALENHASSTTTQEAKAACA